MSSPISTQVLMSTALRVQALAGLSSASSLDIDDPAGASYARGVSDAYQHLAGLLRGLAGGADAAGLLADLDARIARLAGEVSPGDDPALA